MQNLADWQPVRKREEENFIQATQSWHLPLMLLVERAEDRVIPHVLKGTLG